METTRRPGWSITGNTNRENNLLSGVQVQTPSEKLWVVVDTGKN